MTRQITLNDLLLYEARLDMDKSYKKLIKKEKSLEADTKKVLAKDKARDKIIDKAKAKMKGKC